MANPFVGVGGFFGRFFGNTIGESAAYGIGGALREPLHPLLQELTNETWKVSTAAGISKPLDPAEAAEIVAEDVELHDWGVGQAGMAGYTPETFDAVLGAVLNAPGLGPLFEAWRRNLIDDAAFTHGLRKAKLEPRWDAPLRGLKDVLLSLDVLANARQQGFLDETRQHEESALQGLTSDRADILYELSGNPPGPETAQAAANRGLINRATFDQIIREGRTKTKYTDLEWALRQPILRATDYRTLYLKGWITEAEMNAGGALSGYTPEQMHLLYLESGRPAAPGQMATAAARGIDGPDGRPMDEAQFLKGIKESDIRPEWGPMLWDSRFTYPPLFQINRLRQADAIDTATAVEWARKDRLAPEVVTALEAYWNQGTSAGADSHIGKAQTQLWGTLHRSYLADESPIEVAQETLTVLGLSPDTQTAVLDLWNRERALIRKQLTPAQIKKAVTKAVTNPATGAAWTRDEGIAALIQRGYSMADAQTYMGE